jgi:hypothetical protein
MKSRMGVLWIILLALIALAAWPLLAHPKQVEAAPLVFASPINGGCYIAAPNQCYLHVDPFNINIASGKKLVSFQLQSNGVPVYDFRTDVSNPPPASGMTYSPSLVMQDFAAVCGRTYTINVVGKDSGDTNSLNMGLTGAFTCPSSVP